ncbi:MAG: sigma-70 family RNA polymerase sigma factor [Myxococcota bacterium]
MSEPDAETGLLVRARGGDPHAFDALVSATAPAVWTVVRRLTADDATAEDVLQETFMAAWRGIDGYRGEGSARSWLYGLARRHAARTWRRRVGEPRHTESLDVLGSTADDPGWPAGFGGDPEVIASRAEDRATLLRAVATLSESDQEVIVRCDLEGRTPAEVAEELGTNAGALRVRLHRARLRLMDALLPGGVP